MNFKGHLILTVILAVLARHGFGEELELLLNLQSYWKFTIGDKTEWAKADYNDSDWEKIKVPATWEDQGFNGYNGYAWYRIKVKISDVLQNRQLYLLLGYIDDVDEAFFNGHLIGKTGEFPPGYATAYNAQRRYLVPSEAIKYNDINVISVRVYDYQLAGGIVGGKVGIYAGRTSIDLDIDLQGKWYFLPYDDHTCNWTMNHTKKKYLCRHYGRTRDTISSMALRGTRPAFTYRPTLPTNAWLWCWER
ncbi:MAG: hypothetical protein HC896_13555 [Bacteroidales bacterium]|nr:hypothetical protein [Bacteroidales bacterium]